jgi:hypothetical protein
MDGELDDDKVIDHPGESRCRNSCGCATCGCFSCSDSCVFSGFGLHSTGPYYVVTSPDSFTNHYQLTANYWGRDGVVHSQTITTNQFQVNVANLTVTIEGEFANGGIEFGDNYIILDSHSGGAYIGHASAPNLPEVGKVGDIQSSTVATLRSKSKKAFKYAHGLYHIDEKSKHDDYRFVHSGAQTLSMMPVLPTVIDGNFLQLNGSTVIVELVQPGPIQVGVRAEGEALSFTQITDVVCPEAGLIEAAGCYSCPEGFEIIIEARSSCGSGVVTLSSIQNNLEKGKVSILTQSVILSTTIRNFTIMAITDKPLNDFELVIYSPSTFDSINLSVEFLATEPPPLVKPDGEDTILGRDEKGNKWKGVNFFTKGLVDFFSNIFSGAATWWQYIIFIVFVLFCLLVIGILIRVFKWTIGSIFSRNKSKTS